MPEPETPLAERPWEDVERLLDVDTARERVLAAVAPLAAVAVPLLDALDLVLTDDIVAEGDVPPFRNSAMDGYAVRASDTAGATTASPVALRVVGNVAAGAAGAPPVGPGAAVRIMTGAPMPAGADAVVRFEETDEHDAGLAPGVAARRTDVRITRAAKAWDNVRPPGEDVRAGEVVLRAGTRLRPPEIGLLAALGRTTAPVHRRPRVAILSTGDEVVAGGPLRAGQIRDSNSATLAAMTLRAGGVPLLLGVAGDSLGEVSAKLAAAREADLIVTSGGVSLGDFDVVKDVLRAEGEIAVWQVRMKPGKPLAFGRVGGTPLLGLPGNPVAAAVSFEVFARPAIRRMLGRRDLGPPVVEARLLERLDNRGQRRHYVRARVEREPGGELVVRAAGQQGAGVLSSLARANGLLVVPEQIEAAEPGMRLPVWMLDWELGADGAGLIG